MINSGSVEVRNSNHFVDELIEIRGFSKRFMPAPSSGDWN